MCALEENSLTATVSSLPLQTLAIGEGDDVSIGVHTAPGAAAPHAFHCLAGAVGTGGPQGAGHLTRAHAEVWAHWGSQWTVFFYHNTEIIHENNRNIKDIKISDLYSNYAF